MSSLFRSIFGCCLGRPSSSTSETEALLPHNELNPDQLPPSDYVAPRIIRNDEETLAELIRETESKMVNVQDPHPFLSRPPPSRMNFSQSLSASRSRSPSANGSHHLTPEGESSERSQSSGKPGPLPRDPILEVKIIKTCKSKSGRARGRGRGRPRTNARDGSPLAGTAEATEPEDPAAVMSPLSSSSEDLLLSLSTEIRESLVEGFQLVDSGPVIQNWDET